MKYLKTFEIKKEKYNINDYILIKDYYINFWKSKKLGIFKTGKIIDFDYEHGNTLYYTISVIQDNNMNVIYSDAAIIKRKSTKKEILEFETIKDTLKFNL